MMIATQATIKMCPKCGETKPLEAFARNPNGKYGRHAHCSACQKTFYKEWAQRPEVKARRAELSRARYAADPERHRQAVRAFRRRNPESIRKTARKNHLRFYYGLTVDDYERMLEGQDGVCAICTGPSGRMRFHVDHNHTTGRVRGLLCSRCNSGLTLLENDQLLAAASRYLALDIAATTDVRAEQDEGNSTDG